MKSKSPKTRQIITKLAVFIFSILGALVLMQNVYFQGFLHSLGTYGYIGAFITGIFWVFTYTIAPATSVLLVLGKHLNPLMVSVIAGFGAIFGDLVVFRLVEDTFHEEIKHYYTRQGGKRITRFFHGLLPIIGALIIMSPLPDEWGVALMGITNVNVIKFTVLSLVLNTIGIFCLVKVGPFLVFK